MTFFPHKVKREVPPVGSPKAKIALIGEAPGAEENRKGEPFVGQAGGVLNTCLQGAGIIRSECYITNLIKTQPSGNNISPWYVEPNGSRKGFLTELGWEAARELQAELRDVKANILVPLGRPAMMAVLGTDHVRKYRGYVMEACKELDGRKVIPTYHPASALRQYILRYYISNDLKKVKRESAFPEIIRPERELIIPDSYENAVEWLEYFNECERLSIDIEVINYEVSCIGFSDTPERGFSLPLYHSPTPMWSLEHECNLWRIVARVLSNPSIYKVFQNGIFDIHFLRTRCGIAVEPLDPDMYEDTMMAHSVMFPEFLKSLEFLVSLYGGAQQYYKDMVKFKNIKDDA